MDLNKTEPFKTEPFDWLKEFGGDGRVMHIVARRSHTSDIGVVLAYDEKNPSQVYMLATFGWENMLATSNEFGWGEKKDGPEEETK